MPLETCVRRSRPGFKVCYTLRWSGINALLKPHAIFTLVSFGQQTQFLREITGGVRLTLLPRIQCRERNFKSRQREKEVGPNSCGLLFHTVPYIIFGWPRDKSYDGKAGRRPTDQPTGLYTPGGSVQVVCHCSKPDRVPTPAVLCPDVSGCWAGESTTRITALRVPPGNESLR